jgi:hypothetical protein
MSIELPESVAAYFAAENSDDPEALAQCFVDHAVVRDEGRTIDGVAAIRRWNVETKKKYHYNLEHIFRLEGEKIASLEIR